ncbi:MAG: hypothetical protein QOE80_3284, partial [Actinomycetota bacterium]|nr:hypothetical protein [Actinomycetota bacterium]
LFAAVAPANDPQFAVVAVVEEAGFGSAVAAPIVRRVLEVLTGVPRPSPAPPASAPGSRARVPGPPAVSAEPVARAAGRR